MWYRFSESRGEYNNQNIVHPETSILKPGHYRGFHSVIRQDWKDRLPSIWQKGLNTNQGLAEKYQEPSMIWGTTGYEGRYNKSAPTVEYAISPEHLRSAFTPHARSEHDAPDYYDQHWKNPKNYITLQKDIDPEDILAIHEPWHDDVRYVLEDRNKDVLEMVKKDPKDFLQKAEAFGELDRYAPVVEYLIANGYI